MIVLDINVLSEALRPSPNESVLRWLAAQESEAVFTTTITQAEILYRVEVLAAGNRRSRLASAIGKLFTDEFHGRILPFDERGLAYTPRSYRIGRNCAVATRNIRDFEHCGVPIKDPWNN